jgi:hypothetical protein
MNHQVQIVHHFIFSRAFNVFQLYQKLTNFIKILTFSMNILFKYVRRYQIPQMGENMLVLPLIERPALAVHEIVNNFLI